MPCRKWACRVLQRVASPASVPVLEPLLVDPDLSLEARWALQGVPGPEVDAAFRRALSRAQGRIAVGLLESIASRGSDRKAVPVILPLLQSQDSEVVQAAMHTLARLGGAQAWEALQKVRPQSTLRCVWERTLIECAQRSVDLAKTRPKQGVPLAQVLPVIEQLARSGRCPQARVAAFGCLCGWAPAAAREVLATHLRTEPERWAAVWMQTAVVHRLPGLLPIVQKDWDRFPPRVKTAFLERVQNRNSLPIVLRSLEDSNAKVQIAGLRAVVRVGGKEQVPILLQVASQSSGAVQQTARWALARLSDPQVDPLLVKMLSQGSEAVQPEVIRACQNRGVIRAVPLLFQKVRQGTPAVQVVAAEALSALASWEEFPELVTTLAQTESAAVRNRLVQGVRRLCRAQTEKEAAAQILTRALSRATPQGRVALLRLLVEVPSKTALQSLKQILISPPADQKEAWRAALQTLAAWPNDQAWPVWMEVLQTVQDSHQKQVVWQWAFRFLDQEVEQAPALVIRHTQELSRLPSASDRMEALFSLLNRIGTLEALQAAVSLVEQGKGSSQTMEEVVHLAETVFVRHPVQVVQILRRASQGPHGALLAQHIAGRPWLSGRWKNVAPLGQADSPDGLRPDGASGGDRAGIDQNPATYWDEQDGAKLYRYRVRFPKPVRLVGFGLIGYQQENYAPKDFTVVCDGKEVLAVRNARYTQNFFFRRFPEPVLCKECELRITGYYGRSPAIRELLLFAPSE